MIKIDYLVNYHFSSILTCKRISEILGQLAPQRIFANRSQKDPDTKEVIDYRNAIRKFTKFDMKRMIR